MSFIETSKGKIHIEFLNKELMTESSLLLLFLHEGLGSIPQWKSFPSELCDKLSLPGLMYERIGYGESDPIMDERDSSYLEQYAFDELPELIKIIDITNPIVLVGHSDGASIALLYASKFQKKVKALASIAAHVFVEKITVDGIQEAISKKEKIVRALSRYHGDKSSNTFDAWSETWTTPRFFEWNIEHYLKDVICPNYIIQGKEDQYGSEKQVDSIVNNTTGASEKWIISDCGHSPHVESKDNLVEKLTSFISRFK